jgi:hypothetical protein
MAERILVPLRDLLTELGWAATVPVEHRDADVAERLVPLAYELDCEVATDWAGRPAVSPANAARVLARMRGQADPGVRPEPAGAMAKPGLIRSMFLPGARGG